MDRNEKIRRLKEMLKDISPGAELESLARDPSGFESGREGVPRAADREIEQANRGVVKLAHDEEPSDTELNGLEAIILPRERPVVFVRNGSFGKLPSPWAHFSDAAIRSRIEAAIPAVGRVELPDSPWIPYGGTGFVVGAGLLLTNRHVAELFASGLGLRRLAFRPGQTAAVNFKREKDSPDDDQSAHVTVEKVVMIHPYWDMAVLKVAGLPAGVKPLTLSVRAPEDLVDREVAVIGYPARDDRNDLALQDRIFERVYNVKRLHPGKIRARQQIQSFANRVNAMTHDSSTLGGNSGSAVLDVATGEILGLHFAGIYLKANYAVPAFELASDARVVDTGLTFAGKVPATKVTHAAWLESDPDEKRPTDDRTQAQTQTPDASTSGASVSAAAVQTTGMTATWTIPLQVSVTLGMPATAAPVTTPTTMMPLAAQPAAEVEAIRLRTPIIHPNLETRRGYQGAFLELDDGDPVPLPKLTAAGRGTVAKLEDGSFELKYHKFSIVMHKRRRLALFTAANVDWREASRQVNGRKPSRRELTGIPENFAEMWVTDPRIPDGQQLPDRFFTEDGGSFDKGHLVRRDDVCWGDSFDDIQKANGDTYHTTNCSPQVGKFNQSARGVDNWGDLENLVQQQTRAEKAILFSGPVLEDDDPRFRGRDQRGPVTIQIPRQYWKIIVTKGEDGPEAYGFVLKQDLSDVRTEMAVPRRWQRFMSQISDIEAQLNGLLKLTWLSEHDQFDTVRAGELAESVQVAQV